MTATRTPIVSAHLTWQNYLTGGLPDDPDEQRQEIARRVIEHVDPATSKGRD